MQVSKISPPGSNGNRRQTESARCRANSRAGDWWISAMMNTKARILITGGAGFIGTNLAVSYLRDGYPVTVLDNLSRPGVEGNARWLRDRFPKSLRLITADVREPQAV